MLPMVLDFSLDAMSLLDFLLPIELCKIQRPTYPHPRQQTMESTRIKNKTIRVK